MAGDEESADQVVNAYAMSEGFKALEKKATVRQVRYEMRRRGIEWFRAAEELEKDDENEATIELLGNVTNGMYVLGGGEEPWWMVLQVMERGGQSSLMLDPMDGRGPQYRNFHGRTSPVVVKR